MGLKGSSSHPALKAQVRACEERVCCQSAAAWLYRQRQTERLTLETLVSTTERICLCFCPRIRLNHDPPHWSCFQGSPKDHPDPQVWGHLTGLALQDQCPVAPVSSLTLWAGWLLCLGLCWGNAALSPYHWWQVPQHSRVLLPWPRACGNPGAGRRERCRAACRHAKLLLQTDREERFTTEVIFCVNLKDSVEVCLKYF